QNTVQSSLRFSAGWSAAPVYVPSEPLALTTDGADWLPGHDIHVRFHLQQSAVVTAIAEDGAIRTIIHQPMEKGENNIAITPAADWGVRLRLHVAVDAANMAGDIVLSRAEDKKSEDVLKEVKNTAPKKFAASWPDLLRPGDTAPVYADIMNDGAVPV